MCAKPPSKLSGRDAPVSGRSGKRSECPIVVDSGSSAFEPSNGHRGFLFSWKARAATRLIPDVRAEGLSARQQTDLLPLETVRSPVIILYQVIGVSRALDKSSKTPSRTYSFYCSAQSSAISAYSRRTRHSRRATASNRSSAARRSTAIELAISAGAASDASLALATSSRSQERSRLIFSRWKRL